MILTNLTTGASVALSDDLMWTDEHSWSPVVSTVEESLSGAVIIEAAMRKAGRPITLAAPDAESAFHARSIVDVLAEWAALPLARFTLRMRNERVFKTIMRLHEAPALEVKPVKGFYTANPSDPWQIKLKLMEVL